MQIQDYIEEKTVKLSEVKEHFVLIAETFSDELTTDECPHCGDKPNARKHPSGPWTQCIHCMKCNTLTIIIEPDSMGGNSDVIYKTYKAKEPK